MDIRNGSDCIKACEGVNFVLHQAALGSVRSIKDPVLTNSVNVSGFLNMLQASKKQVALATYASSSSVYGDSPMLPKREAVVGLPLSPYALTKLTNEKYSECSLKLIILVQLGFDILMCLESDRTHLVNMLQLSQMDFCTIRRKRY